MKKIVCDRCNHDATKKLLDCEKNFEYDLCEICYEDFQQFLENKPLIDLRKILK